MNEIKALEFSDIFPDDIARRALARHAAGILGGIAILLCSLAGIVDDLTPQDRAGSTVTLIGKIRWLSTGIVFCAGSISGVAIPMRLPLRGIYETILMSAFLSWIALSSFRLKGAMVDIDLPGS